MKLNIIIYILILIFGIIFSSQSLAVFPFEINQINFSDKKYSATELINLLYKIELYTPIPLGSDYQKYFSIISLEDHHPMLTESNCAKMKVFQKNKNIIKKGYIIINSKTSKYLGNYSDYLNSINFVEFYSEKFSFFNSTLIEENNNNVVKSEIILVRDNYTESITKEQCLSIGLGEYYKVYASYSPPHFINDLYSKRAIKTYDWTLKYTNENNGFLIIGDLPHNYENDTIKYSEKNYTVTNTKNIVTFFRPWGLEMKEIYFYNETDRVIVSNIKNEENKFTITHDLGFIIGSNKYKQLIYNNYFENLINKKICDLEISDKTIYHDLPYYVDTDGSYSMFICDKEKMNNHIKNFPTLYFDHLGYDYTFELTYKDLFKNISNYYYFMIIFSNNQTGKGLEEEWYIGQPFLKQYQFILNEKTIGFYRTKNYNYDEKDNDNDNGGSNNDQKSNEKKNKFWIYILQILLVLILIGAGVFIGMLIKKQRKKRANELKDDDYDYSAQNENENGNNKNDFIN